jgi:hypothetical protein
MGNDSNLTSGCVFLECNDVVMSSSSFINFKAGAIYSIT